MAALMSPDAPCMHFFTLSVLYYGGCLVSVRRGGKSGGEGLVLFGFCLGFEGGLADRRIMPVWHVFETLKAWSTKDGYVRSRTDRTGGEIRPRGRLFHHLADR